MIARRHDLERKFGDGCRDFFTSVICFCILKLSFLVSHCLSYDFCYLSSIYICLNSLRLTLHKASIYN